MHGLIRSNGSAQAKPIHLKGKAMATARTRNVPFLKAPTISERISQRIGGLPYLSAIWDHGPLVAAMAMLIVDFGIVCLLMLAEGHPPWHREHYKTFLWNDTIFIPLYLAVVVAVLKDAPPITGFHTERRWHYFLLAGAFVLSLLVETAAIHSGQYTIGQQLSPSKLWHTFVFGIVGYWLSSSLIPLLLAPKSRWAVACILIAAAGASYNCYRDLTIRPFPYDAHLEGTYVPWRWTPRT